MKWFVLGLAAIPFLSNAVLAAEPVPLSDQQMDKVTAGHVFSVTETTNKLFIAIDIDQPATAIPANCTNCGIVIRSPYVNFVAAFGRPVGPTTAP